MTAKPSDNSRKSLRYTIIAAFFILLLLIYGFISFVNNIPRSADNNEIKADAIVILTGGSERMSKGIELLNLDKAEKLFVSGVGRETNISSLLINSGRLPDNIQSIMDKIELGYDAKNTCGNALETANWARSNGFKDIILVTSNYHAARSAAEFRRNAPDLNLIVHPVFPEGLNLDKWWQDEPTRKFLIMEYIKYLISKYGPFNCNIQE